MNTRAGQPTEPAAAARHRQNESEKQALKAVIRERDLQLEVAYSQIDMLRAALHRLIVFFEDSEQTPTPDDLRHLGLREDTAEP